MSTRPGRWHLATATVAALIILAIAAECQRVTIEDYQPECRSWIHGDPMPTKDNPVPTAIVRCVDP